MRKVTGWILFVWGICGILANIAALIVWWPDVNVFPLVMSTIVSVLFIVWGLSRIRVKKVNTA